MSDVFISYSRRDSEFVTRLAAALEARGKDVWLDVEGIRAGEVFPEVLRSAIEASDAFVFVISEDSIASTFCADEVAHAESFDKRVLPVLLRSAGEAEMPAGIRDRNWIGFTDPSGFDDAVDELVTALDLDLDHVRQHTRWLVKAIEWDSAGRARGLLPRGSELSAAESWQSAAASREPAPTDLQREFLASARRASTRRLRAVTAASSTTAAVAVALLVFALLARQDAVHQRKHAQVVAVTEESERLGSQALTNDRVDLSMLFAREGVALKDSVGSRGYLLTTLLRDPSVIGLIHGVGNSHQQMALSPDGRELVIAGGLGRLVALDTRLRRQLLVPVTLAGKPLLSSIVFSPDGTEIAVGGDRGLVVLLDAHTLKVTRTFDGVQPHPVSGLAVSADGRKIAATCTCTDASRTAVWDVSTGRELAYQAIPFGVAGVATGLFFTSDSSHLVLTRGTAGTLILDSGSLRQLRSFPQAAVAAQLSPDGHTLAIGGVDGSLRFLNVESGHLQLAAGRHTAPINSITFTANGDQAFTTSSDESVIDWNVEDAIELRVFTGYAGCSCGAAVSSDGSTLYTDGGSGDIVIRDLEGSRRFVSTFATGRLTTNYPNGSLSRDGKTLAVVQADGSVHLIDLAVPRSERTIPASSDGAYAVAFSPDGQHLAVMGRSVVSIYSAATLAPVGQPLTELDASGLDGIAYAVDGESLFVLYSDGVVYRVALGAHAGSGAAIAGVAEPLALAVSPDGHRLAVSLDNGVVQIMDAKTGAIQLSIQADPSGVFALAFSPNEELLLTGGQSVARLWDSHTGKAVGPPLAGLQESVSNVSFSHDGRMMATAGGAVQLYAVPSGAVLGGPVKASAGSTNVWFSPDDSFIYSIDDAGSGFRMPVTTQAWERAACAIAGRSLSRTEWDAYVPGQPYRPDCS